MKVVILAGGLGTRLRPVVKDVPKPMADIAGTPFLELLLENLRFYGAEEFILCVSHLWHVIEEYFGPSYKGIPIQYSVEAEPLGTGGAVKQAFDLYHLEEALVINGDTFVQADYAAFWQAGSGERLAVLLKSVENADRYGRIEVTAGRITSFREKKQNGKPGLINAGVYRVTARLFTEMPQKFSFEKDLMEPQVANLHPRMFLAEDYFIDIGTPESYEQACCELKAIIKSAKDVHTVSNLKECLPFLPFASTGKTPALFLDRDGVINIEKNYVYKIEDCEFIEGIFDLCREAKARGCKIIVVTNQAGIAKGYYTEEDFFIFMDYMKGEFKRQGCPLDDVFYCPFHIEGYGKYRQNSEDRKPNPGMLLKAAVKFNIDLESSIFIGDKIIDIQAGMRARIGKKIHLVHGLHNL